ncbi:hypothetical protein ACFPU1_16855 [Thalassorhabdus alkalitolerans]|uniref:Uncharacterized protein n=1 Tax=Thalassorhabdus alkalitolerans TaxID=2282697 RepID=A0ABW0YUY9_9BACI
MLVAAVVLRYFGIASKMYLLDQTPTEILVITSSSFHLVR